MSQATDQQQDFRELAGWVIDQAKKAGADDCRVNLWKRRFVDITYREHKPEVIKEAITQGLSLEVYVNNRFAGRSTPDFRKSTMGSFITEVIDNARIMEEDPYRTLPDPKYYAGRSTADLQLADPSQSQLTSEDRHNMVRTIEEACINKGGSKVISVEAGENDESYEELTMSSNGFEGLSQGTSTWLGASMTAQDEGDRRPSGYYQVGCRYREDLPSLQEIGTKAAQNTLELMGGKKIPTETLPVILVNRGASRVVSGLLNALSAGNIQQKRSFLADKKGAIIGSRLLTIQDDPFIPRALGSKYFDGDGFPARRRNLFDQGKVNEFLVDWYYSRKLGWEPTSGSISNLVIPPGSRDLETIIKDLGRCIVVTDFIGGNSNNTTGDFSVGIIGKLYDKGELVRNVAELNIADNHLKFWNRLIEVGNDPWIYSQARFPSLVFDKVVVAGI